MVFRTQTDTQHGKAKAFLWALGLSFAIFTPLMIYNRGYFIFLGDFNVQQIPFYRLAHEMVRSGNIFWNWNTDLGANFIGSYSFYLLFSPFFWLTLPFPTDFVPHLMAPLLMLKTACASLTAYLYIKRFVRDINWAVVGAVLYAFSGFMTFNIFFNHFHDVCVFFPLLLVALEELVVNDRRGFFAVMVAVNCLINYWFFIGEVVFVILYVFIRIATGGWGCSFAKFMRIAFEAVLGVALSAICLIPSVLALMGNPRTGTDNLINGWLMWVYGFNQRLPAIIQSFFFPPELPSRPNFFPDMGAKWASLSAWLPLFSTTGVIAFCMAKRHNFHKRMIILSMIMALVPVFNATFVLFNHSYYARWFYMPVLMMCVATVTALEERDTDAMRLGWISGWRWTAGFIFVISAAVAFSPVADKEGQFTFGLYDNAAGFWLIVFAAMLCLSLSAILLFLLRDSPAFQRVTCILLSFIIVAFTSGYLISGKSSKSRDDWFVDVAIDGRKALSLPDEPFARSDLYECMDNLGMFWGLPNIQAFHSIVPASIMEFYPYVGIKRDVSSKPPTEYTALRALLSVRWLIIAADNKEQYPMPDYTLFDEQLGYNIYQNSDYLPMGFAYEFAVNDEAMKSLSGEQKVRHMLHALQLSDAAIIRNFDIIEELPAVDYSAISEIGLQDAIDARSTLLASSFVIDNRGFTATANLPQERLMFFSVPYDKGWQATVNGVPAVIEKANVGFMAVRVPSGEATIRFDYVTPGLVLGTKITLSALVILALYLLLAHLLRRRHSDASYNSPPAPPLAPPSQRPRSLEEYLETLDELPYVPSDIEEDDP
ncbi:YfhO family protein [Oscillospiraceae bacterium LTW-04]|nr:YfhO family protein [Oscillospiraceae bacterium MB24-C1]